MENNVEVNTSIDGESIEIETFDKDVMDENGETFNDKQNIMDRPAEAETDVTTKTEEKQIITAQDVNNYQPGIFTDKKGNLKVVNLVVRYPCLIFFLILISTLVISFLLVKIVFEAGNPFAEPGSEYDINDIRSTAYDSFRLAQEEVEKQRTITNMATTKKARIQEDYLDVTYWVYESETKNGLFSSAESISAMKESLDLFTNHKDYQDFCWKFYINIPFTNSTMSQCRPLLSALNMYYASHWDTEKAQSVIDQLSNSDNVELYNGLSLCLEYDSYCELVPEELLTDENKQWFEALNNNITSILFKLDGKGELSDDKINQMTLFAAQLMKLNTKRGIVDFFYDKHFTAENPISMYSRATINWGGPLNVSKNLEDEDEDVLKRYIVDNFLKEMKNIASTSHNSYVNSYYFMGVLILDVLLDITKRDAMLAFFSFGFVFFYIRVAVGSWFLALVGFLETLLSIPVSWFLFTVVFQIKYFSFLNTLCLFIVAAIGADDIFIFMDAYKHSAQQGSSVLDSLESRMSWVYRRAGNAMAITSATTCAAFLCTLITPLVGVRAFGVFAAIVIFIDYVLVMSLFCTSVVIYHNKFEKQSCCSSCMKCCRTIDATSTQKAFESAESSLDGEKSNKVGSFFRKKVSRVVLAPTSRAILAVLFVSWLVLAIMSAIKLEPTRETEQFLNENHPLQKSFSILGSKFSTAEEDQGLMIYFTWGIEDVDRSGVNQLMNPDYLGTPRFSSEFNFNEECQTNMLRACDDLKTNSEYSPFIKQEGGLGSIKCFVQEFGAYSVLGSLDNCEAVKNGSWKNQTWQVSPANISNMMESFRQLKSCCSDESESISSYYGKELGWNGTHVRYASIALESSELDPFSTKPEEFVQKQYDAMISISNDFDSYMKDSCGSNYMTDTRTAFVFMNNQSIYKKNALQSSMLGLAIAFVVLLISTRVFHLAFFATMSIFCVLLSVIGTMVMLGWTLGSIESILICILAGFSVDYVVHLAHAYERATGNTSDRIKAAFGEMGISVFNGMFTSVGASIPLFFCRLQFFKKFGTFLCLTIAFSWIFANFAFMSVLAHLKIHLTKKKCCSF